MILVEGAVAAALVAAVAVFVFTGLRTYGLFKSLKKDAEQFRAEVEPTVRELAAIAEGAGAKAERLSSRLAAINAIAAGMKPGGTSGR